MTGEQEQVDHPAHYGGADNVYETIKVLEAWLSPEELIGFLKGNALKYLSRAGKKGADRLLEDLKKAEWYLRRMIETIEKRQSAREAGVLVATMNDGRSKLLEGLVPPVTYLRELEGGDDPA